MRSLDQSMAVTTQISPTQVVGQNEDEIRRFCIGCNNNGIADRDEDHHCSGNQSASFKHLLLLIARDPSVGDTANRAKVVTDLGDAKPPVAQRPAWHSRTIVPI